MLSLWDGHHIAAKPVVPLPSRIFCRVLTLPQQLNSWAVGRCRLGVGSSSRHCSFGAGVRRPFDTKGYKRTDLQINIVTISTHTVGTTVSKC